MSVVISLVVGFAIGYSLCAIFSVADRYPIIRRKNEPEIEGWDCVQMIKRSEERERS